MSASQHTGLSNVQKELLKIYSTNISDDELLEIKRLLAYYFASKATLVIDTFFHEKGFDNETLKNWTKEHNRI